MKTKCWRPGDTVNHFVTHNRPDADELLIFAIRSAFPDIVGKALPGLKSAKIGFMTMDIDGLEDFSPPPDAIFVGVGKGRFKSSFDEHADKRRSVSAATLLVKTLPLRFPHWRALQKTLGDVVYEDEWGTRLPWEIPGVIKWLHNVFTTEEVLEWSRLAYYAEIMDQKSKFESGYWEEDKRNWQPLTVPVAYELIKKYVGEKSANDWLEMFDLSAGFTETLKLDAVNIVRNFRSNGGTVDHLETRYGPVKVLTITTNNFKVADQAITKEGFDLCIVRSEEGNTQIIGDRRRVWCFCDIAGFIRAAECRKRGLPVPENQELLSLDSVSGCRWWNVFQEAPYIVNGTLKHDSVEPSELTLDEVFDCVAKGLRGRFVCPNWKSHTWLQRGDNAKAINRARNAEVEHELEEKRAVIDADLEAEFAGAFASAGL